MEEAREKLSVHFLYTNIVNDYYVFDVKVFKEEVKLYFDNKKNYQKFNYSCKHNDNNNLSTFDKAKRYSNYPINVARNFGRNQSTSKYILIADMNHLFSKNFEKKMIQLGEKIFKKSKKFALTYRIFEISKDISILPDTKELLRKYILEKKAFEFHHYMTAHKIPYLKNWLSYHQEDDHNINYQFITNLSNSQWEPQFVSLRDIPYHDESFFYPVRDNTVLRWEMCYQDYQFVIAHDVFMFHQGIKSTKENEAVQLAKKNIFPWAVEVMNNFEKRMNKTYMNKNNCPKPDKYGFGAGLEIQKYMEYPKIFGF
uniref:N-acetyllactosaminide beta-1,3-N-acetylglucosaminyltransferase n=1 Tax=Parastrongyloides trichosuri TaxID=131310 RepID=A0A0N5A743_PARTI